MADRGLMGLLFEQATSRGARSTALHALQWAMAILVLATIGGLWGHAPTWLLVTLAGLLVVVVLLFVVAYCILMAKNPDALRSERFTLSKMAIERGLIGDSVTGLVDEELGLARRKQLPAAKRKGANGS